MSEIPWSAPKRVGFRFLFAYFLLYSLPFPLGILPWTGWITGPFYSARNAMATWVGTNLLGLEVVIQPTGSGDTAHQFSLLFCFVVLSAVIAAVWSLVDRSSDGYEQLHDWIRVYVRYVLASTMLSYGGFKVIKSQFPFPRLDQLLTRWGDSSPMGLVWRFMGFSTPYSTFGGAMEMVGGFLLLFRRTTLVGALVTVSVMSNVVMLNYAYDVPVKLYSTNLLFMAAFLTLPDLGRLLNFFVLNRATPRGELGSLFTDVRMRRVGWVVKGAFVIWAVWTPLNLSYSTKKSFGDDSPKPALWGIWNVDEQVVGTDTIPPLLTDSTRWRRLVVDRRQTRVHHMTGERPSYRQETDTVAGTFTLTANADTTSHMNFTYTLPAPDQMSAWAVVEGDTLRLRLTRFDETTFLLLSRGYNWINELPFNR